MRSASIVDKAISDCDLEDQAMGQLACLIMNPDLHKTERKHPESLRFYAPAKSVSAQSSKPLFLFGLNIKPLSLVRFKHLLILLIALPCEAFGLLQNQLVW